MTMFPEPPAAASRAATPLPAGAAAPASAISAPGDDAGATAQRQLVLAAARARHWQRTLRLSTGLLLAWLATTFGSAFFARELAGLSLFGWPLSFYLAAQGAALIYLAILAVYALAMRRLDDDFHHRIESNLVGGAAPATNAAARAAPPPAGPASATTITRTGAA